MFSLDHDRAHVVGNDDAEDPAEEPQAASKPLITSSVDWVNVGQANWWRLKQA